VAFTANEHWRAQFHQAFARIFSVRRSLKRKALNMRKTAVMAGILVVALTAAAAAQQQDEKAIRSLAESFVKAYNAKDAKALAALFVANGEIVNQEGKSVQGQEAIQREFAQIFKQQPKAHIKATLRSLRFLGPNLAVEDGSSTVSNETGATEERNLYTVIHVKQNDQWRMASARDLPDQTSSGKDEIKQLDWLVGQWVDESPDKLVETTYRWSDDHRFLVSEYKVQIEGQPAIAGTERIGWDPLAQKIRSWEYDSHGGFGEGLWTRNGNQWIVKMTGETHDGQIASSTNIITQVSKDRTTWQSKDRVIGEEWMKDIEEIPVVRKPPMPSTPVKGTKPVQKGETL
jgi:uncharacterized protein (TIGR02246 family)